MQINPEGTIQRSEEIISSEVENELVMMSLKNGKYYGMDSIGKDIWKLTEQPVKVKEVYNQLQKEYEIDQETCEKDVNAFLTQLKEQELISIGE